MLQKIFSLYLQHQEGHVNIMQEFWDSITQMLTNEFNNASEGRRINCFSLILVHFAQLENSLDI